MDPESSSSDRPRKKFDGATEDRISSLPKTAIDVILIRLPLKEAARTSILSRSWRYEWTNLSHLVFDGDDFPFYELETQDDYDIETVNIIDQVLLFHQGSIHSFVLSDIELGSWKYIDRWLYFVSRNGVREFVLRMPGLDGIFKIPSSLFSCKELVNLELSGCELTLPSSFRGFSNLKTLVLRFMNFSKSSLEKLITACPLLAKLTLECILGFPNLAICAPNLVDLEVGWEFNDISFEETPLLARAAFFLGGDVEYQPIANGHACKLANILGCLPRIRRLELSNQSYQILSGGEVPVRLLTKCSLLYLSAFMNLKDSQQMSIARWIFRSSPLLQEVVIQSIENENNEELVVDYWDMQKCFDGFNQLKILRLLEFRGTKAELRFLQFVLGNAPVLELVHIELAHNFTEVTDFLKDLVRLRRLSSNAEIVKLYQKKAEIVIPK